MRIILTFLVVALAAGCTTSKRGTSRVDPFDDIRVDQMAGNNVSGAVLQKIVLCLNARRETRPITGLTNIVVTPVTNLSVLVLTNQTLSASTNFFVTTATNLSPAVPPFPASTAPAGGDVSLETAPETAATRANPVAMTTNLTLTIARNQSGTTSPTQTAANNQAVRTLSNQITTVSNNLAVLSLIHI